VIRHADAKEASSGGSKERTGNGHASNRPGVVRTRTEMRHRLGSEGAITQRAVFVGRRDRAMLLRGCHSDHRNREGLALSRRASPSVQAARPRIGSSEAVSEAGWICAFAKERTGSAPPPMLVGLSEAHSIQRQ